MEQLAEERAAIGPKRWRKLRIARPTAMTLSLVSTVIAVLALVGFIYTAYEDIKPTLVVSPRISEKPRFERSEKLEAAISIANTGRRSARDVRIRIDRAAGCAEFDSSVGQLQPGFQAVPWFETCEANSEWMKVEVSYKWDMGFYTISYRTSETFMLNEYWDLDIRPY